jgi:SPOR domain
MAKPPIPAPHYAPQHRAPRKQTGGNETAHLTIFKYAAMIAIALFALILCLWGYSHYKALYHAGDGSLIAARAGNYKQVPEVAAAKNGFEDDALASIAAPANIAIETRVERPMITPNMGQDEIPQAPPIRASAQSDESAIITQNEQSLGLIQLGAYGNVNEPKEAWNRLAAQFPQLATMRYRVVEAQIGSAPVYWLQAMAGNSANDTCKALKAAQVNCQLPR